MKKIISVMQKTTRWCCENPAWTLLFIVLLSLGIKFILWRVDPMISRDASFYLHNIRDWQESGIMPQSFIPPMFYCLVRAVMTLGLGPEHAGVWLNLVSGSLLTVIIYGIAMESTCSRKISLFAAALMAFHSSINALSHEVQRDVPYLFFAGAAVWLAIAGFRRKKWYLLAAAGAFTALSLATRYETLEIILIVFCTLTVFAAVRCFSWKQSIGYGLSFTCAFFSVLILFFIVSGYNDVCAHYRYYFGEKLQAVGLLPADETGGK
ncbi:MAG: glycosyltransferase family 39 protein [Lentisphaeria bacterium]|nr:glycosyltransferase family 39 protein [Lentisphaeria bacterium]